MADAMADSRPLPETSAGHGLETSPKPSLSYEVMCCPIPSVFDGNFKVIDIPKSSAAADEIVKLFPCLCGQPWSRVVESQEALESDHKLKIGLLHFGDQEMGTQNVLRGIYNYFQTRAKEGVTIYAFLEGLIGFFKSNFIELEESNFIFGFKSILGCYNLNYKRSAKIESPYQISIAAKVVTKLDLDALVVIGGDEANTTAGLLAENFRSNKVKTRVIGCPNKWDLAVKTIDGDLDCKQILEVDPACKICAGIVEVIGDMMKDARLSGEYYHFVGVTRRITSPIMLECALQTNPNIALFCEEVTAKKLSLMDIRDHIVHVICKRSELGYNYGVILIPEGLFYSIPEVQKLIAELVKIWYRSRSTLKKPTSKWKKKLSKQSGELFDLLPRAIQNQLFYESDPLNDVRVDKLGTDRFLIELVETELEKRKREGLYKGDFKAQTNIYALGYAAAALVQSDKTGLIASLGNLGAPVEEWTVGGIPFTCLMDVKRRHDGTLKPVIKNQAMVELDGAPFNKFASMRDEWALRK